MTNHSDGFDRSALLAESDAVVAAIQEAVRETVLEHKRAGLPVVEWRNGRVELVPPEELDDVDES
jgi:hypothetical protein